MSELLAMLNAKPGNYQAMPAGGVPDITPEMVSAACCGLTRHVYLYALYKFAGQEDVLRELWALNRAAVKRRAILQKWNIQLQHLCCVGDLADSVLAEALTENRCLLCKGAGVNDRMKRCPACQGSGNGKRWSARKRARNIGISHTTFRNTWAVRYADCFREFGYFDKIIDQEIRYQLFSG